MSEGYKRTEVGVIPEPWGVSSVGDEFSIQLGKMLDAEKNIGVLKPYLGNRAVQWGRIDLNEVAAVRMTPSDLKRYRLQDGDLLVCEGGEVGRAAIWRAEIDECYFQKALHRLRAKRGYNVRLMLNILRLQASSGFLSGFVTQTSIAHLPKDKFKEVPIPLPPTAEEQEAIAEALGDADGLIESLERLIAKKRQIKQGAMQELLTGKKRLPGFTAELREKNLLELGRFLKGRGVSRGESETGSLACVRYGEIYTRHSDYIRAFHSRISPVVAASATRIQRGDILFAGSGETKEEIGKCVAVVTDCEAYAGGDIVILRVDDGDPLFLGYYLNTPVISRQKASAGQGDAVVHIGAKALGAISGNFPPTFEQQAIAAVLSDMDAEIERLEKKLEKAQQIKQGMMQELLTGKIRLI